VRECLIIIPFLPTQFLGSSKLQELRLMHDFIEYLLHACDFVAQVLVPPQKKGYQLHHLRHPQSLQSCFPFAFGHKIRGFER
jgi:hypothetical protein